MLCAKQISRHILLTMNYSIQLNSSLEQCFDAPTNIHDADITSFSIKYETRRKPSIIQEVGTHFSKWYKNNEDRIRKKKMLNFFFSKFPIFPENIF